MKLFQLYKYCGLTLLFMIWSCKSGPANNYEELELLSYGMPIAIMAPPESVIEKEDFGVLQGVTVKGENYDIQVYSGIATTLSVSQLKSDKLAEVKTNPYFSKIIEEEDDGFIYLKDIDGQLRYDFRHIKIIGDKDFIFQKGLLGSYTESQIRSMYESVK